jgi:Family of unknown function (DUF6459)
MAYERGRAADESVLVTVAGGLAGPERGRTAPARSAPARGRSSSGRPGDRTRHARALPDKPGQGKSAASAAPRVTAPGSTQAENAPSGGAVSGSKTSRKARVGNTPMDAAATDPTPTDAVATDATVAGVTVARVTATATGTATTGTGATGATAPAKAAGRPRSARKKAPAAKRTPEPATSAPEAWDLTRLGRIPIGPAFPDRNAPEPLRLAPVQLEGAPHDRAHIERMHLDRTPLDRTHLERVLFEQAPPDRTARSWVVGWTHRIAPSGTAGDPATAIGAVECGPLVRRLVEAVVDVLLERRPAEQVRRCVSREVFSMLSTSAPRRAARFAARAMVRSIRLHAPADDAVESTVLVQDGARVRAIALRFERAEPDALQRQAIGYRSTPERLEWRCTALQFG